jgi:multicomponent Na+:H+ antiporter subunit A
VLDVLRSLGAEVDRQEEEDAPGHPGEVSEPREEALPVSVAGTSPTGRGDA